MEKTKDVRIRSWNNFLNLDRMAISNQILKYQFEHNQVESDIRITIYVMAHLEAGYYP